MLKRSIALMAAAACAFAACAADNCGFERVPKDALKALQEARGKPFTAGAVFVNGKYIKPPYTVSRYGTALMVNGNQVSGPLVPWQKFLAAVKPAGEKAAEAEETPAEDVEIEAASLDELFEDETAKPAAKAEAEPAKFTHNAKSKALLQDIDRQRSALDKALRQDRFFFFSPRYSSVSGNLKTLGTIIEKLPDELRAADSAEDLSARLRRAGLGIISSELCTDLYANKLTFPALYELRTRVRERIREQRELESSTGSF